MFIKIYKKYRLPARLKLLLSNTVNLKYAIYTIHKYKFSLLLCSKNYFKQIIVLNTLNQKWLLKVTNYNFRRMTDEQWEVKGKSGKWPRVVSQSQPLSSCRPLLTPHSPSPSFPLLLVLYLSHQQQGDHVSHISWDMQDLNNLFRLFLSIHTEILTSLLVKRNIFSNRTF